jgi:putative copper export protein
MRAATGPLNATVHMTSWQQFLTTPYGWVLAVKIECFLLMVVISAYHAFYLRPWLVQSLTQREGSAMSAPGQTLVEVAHGRAGSMIKATPGAGDGASGGSSKRISGRAEMLVVRLEGWLQREAILGGAVLLCVALLTMAFVGTLVPPI